MAKKILFFTDFHINYKLFNSINAHGSPQRADEIYSTFNWINTLVEKYNISHVIFGGDLYNSVNDLKLPFIKLAMDGFGLIKAKIHVLDGNHDLSDKNFYATSLLKYVVDEVIHDTDSAYIPDLGVRFTFFPFFRDLQTANSQIKQFLKHKEPTVVFMHQGITGKCIDDLAVEASLFNAKNVKKVFSGHYHFSFEEGKIVFPGSCFPSNFTEEGGRKAVIYDIDTDELIYEENPVCSFFVSLPQKSITENMDKLTEMANKCYIRVELASSKEELTIPYDFLEKFRGYVITAEEAKKEFTPQYSYVDSNFTTAAVATVVEAAELDFNYEAYKNLVLNTAENLKYVSEYKVDKDTLEEVLKTSFEVGI